MLSLKTFTLFATVAASLVTATTVIPYDSNSAASCGEETVAVDLGGLCVCVNLLSLGDSTGCPSCDSVANAIAAPVCPGLNINLLGLAGVSLGTCGCMCEADAYATADGSACLATAGCSGELGTISYDSNGFGSCTCSAGYQFDDSTGVCTLAPSARARRARRSALNAQQHRINPNSDAYLCPMEGYRQQTACSIPSSATGAYECIDTFSEVVSCGGCIGRGGVDCTSLPGVRGVTCDSGRCRALSCASGWYLDYATQECLPLQL